MKILFVVKYPDKYQTQFSSGLDSPETLSYDDLISLLFKDFYGILYSLIYSLRDSGIEAELIVPNFKLLQKKWAQENNIQFADNWEFEIADEQAKKYQADILFFGSNFEYFDTMVPNLKRYSRYACVWISCPFDTAINFSHIDHVFTLFQPHYDYFTKRAIASTLTQAGFDPKILESVNSKKEIPLSFIGGIGRYHKRRERILKKIIRNFPIKIWGYGYVSDHPFKNFVKQMANGFAFKKSYMGEAWGLKMYEILGASGITINIHGDIADGHAVNMRMFEATGMGSLLITEYSEGIAKFFTPDVEVVCYKNENEAIEKIGYYLTHEEERKKIALAGQKKTLTHFTYQTIIKDYIRVFNSLDKN